MDEKRTDHKENRERGHLHDRPVCPRLDLQEAVRFQYFASIFRDYLGALEGDIVECGVGWGRSMLYLCPRITLGACVFGCLRATPERWFNRNMRNLPSS